MTEAGEIDFETDADAMAKARAKMRAKGFKPGTAARKERETKVRAAVDGRSLRATGRTAQFNLKCRPEIKAAVTKVAKAEGLSIAEWMERTLETALGVERH